ncbi:helix-turn-helix domain-containing protein [Marinoscillum luteum]|uniref:Helix-turn-helix domain-containing protein n=1 Tax=Marinoscillum luteum TaxID=861051 RepID=A0ABW7NAK1_9BACT
MAFIADRLKSARIMNGLSLQGLADQLKELGQSISKQALNKYEQGESTPNSEMIGFLCEALGVRPDYFSNATLVEFGEIEFRKLSTYPGKERDRIEEVVKDKVRRYLELEQILNLQTEFKNPLEGFPINTIDDIDDAAKELRKEWDIGENPIPNTIELLEEHGIKVVEIISDVKLDAFATKINGAQPLVVLNNAKLDHNLDRKRFSAMHELGHILLKLDQHDDKTKERFCHYFAGALLFPKERIYTELGRSRSKLSFKELGMLKQEYGISMQAIMYRAKELGVINQSTFKQFYFMFNRLGYRNNEPYSYKGFEESNRFSQLLFRGLVEEAISMSKAAALNNQKLADFRKENMII